MEKLNKSQSQAALVQSINEGIKVQNQTRFQRTNKRSQNEADTSASANVTDAPVSEAQTEPQPSTSGSRNSYLNESVGPRSAKKSKLPDDRKVNNADNSGVSAHHVNYGDSTEDLELIFKPHPSENDWTFTKFFTDEFKRYLKTSSDATGKNTTFKKILRVKSGDSLRLSKSTFLGSWRKARAAPVLSVQMGAVNECCISSK